VIPVITSHEVLHEEPVGGTGRKLENLERVVASFVLGHKNFGRGA